MLPSDSFAVPEISSPSNRPNRATIRQNPVDARPFLSNAELQRLQERQQALMARFQGLGNRALIAVIGQMKVAGPADDSRSRALQAWRGG